MSSCESASRIPRPRTRRLGVALAVLPAGWLLACAAPPVAPPIRYEGPLRIVVQSPRPGSSLGLRDLRVRVRGRAKLSSAGEAEPLDVFLLVDVSPGTRLPSGLDVDGDGEVGFDPHQVLMDLEPGGLRCTDPEDTILQAEVAAARRLLDHLSGRTDRVGLAFFSEAPAGARGGAILPLGTPIPRVRGALAGALDGSPRGMALDDAMRIAGDALARGRPAARRAVLTLRASAGDDPPPEPPRGVESVTLAVTGRDARHPRSLRRPLDALAWLAGPDASGPGTLGITNTSLRATGADAFLGRDGRFSGWIPVRDGGNRLRVEARDVGGRSGAAVFDLRVAQELPSHWEMLQQLGEIQRRNQQLIRMIETVEERGPGELEIRIDRDPGAAAPGEGG